MDSVLKILEIFGRRKILLFLNPVLNILFVSGITYSICVQFYPSLAIPDTIQLKSCIEYFLKGEFIVPFGVFVLAWNITSVPSELVFKILNSKITKCIEKKVLAPLFITNNSQTNIPKWVNDLYSSIRKTLSESKKKELKLILIKTEIETASNFVLLIRSMIAIILYFVQVSYFGWVLFVSLIILQIIIFFVLVIGYQLAVIIPILNSKLATSNPILEEKEPKLQ
jgi:hypothetical protein